MSSNLKEAKHLVNAHCDFFPSFYFETNWLFYKICKNRTDTFIFWTICERAAGMPRHPNFIVYFLYNKEFLLRIRIKNKEFLRIRNSLT